MIAPGRFVLGKGVLKDIDTYINMYGTRAIVIATESGFARVRKYVGGALSDAVQGDFSGECTKDEIARLAGLCRSKGCDVIIGIGGGKALDTSKAVAHELRLPVLVVPTIASTDAPCSSLAVSYNADGSFDSYLFFHKNPDLVLVDSQVIADASVRYLVSGMGDALATYYEARSCVRASARNIPGGASTLAARAIAEQCLKTLTEESDKAIAACRAHVVIPALENIIEANILLSGIGFESSGLAAAHAVHDGLTVLKETHAYYHGEKVAFGTLVHLVLENAPMEEIIRVIDYCKKVGLPTRLSDLGVTEVTEEKIMSVAIASCAKGETIHNMPFPVTPDLVYAAILAADQLGT